jgi:signal peptidase I
MLNTILIEDHLMVNKFVFGNHAPWMETILPYREIQRGDIIVFKYPKYPETNYVKRVVGLPGETIEVHGTRVYIDGKELPENKVRAHDPCMRCDLQLVGEPVTADGAQWTAYYNDLRDSVGPDDSGFSLITSDALGQYGVGRKPIKIGEGEYFCMGDNRDNSEDSRVWGTVPRDNVVGRAMFVYWSIDQQGRAEDEPSSLLSDFVQRTRWGRTGTLIK